MLETQYFRRHEQWTANARFEEFVIELILHIVLEEHRSHINFSTCMSYAYCNETEVGQLHIPPAAVQPYTAVSGYRYFI